MSINRRAFIASSLFLSGGFNRVIAEDLVALGWCWPRGFATKVHNEDLRNYLAFTREEFTEKSGDTSNPVVIGSGVKSGAAGWNSATIAEEDMVIWVKRDSQYNDVDMRELSAMFSEPGKYGVNLFHNSSPIKQIPNFRMLETNGISTENLEARNGASSYNDLLEMAMEASDPVVVGLRGVNPVGMRPLRINGSMPITGSNYPLRKEIIFYYRQEEDPSPVWDRVSGVLQKEDEADSAAYSNFIFCKK